MSETPPTSATDDEPGWAVLHLFCQLDETTDRGAIERAIKAAETADHQVITVALLGHKADLAVMGIGPSMDELRLLQSALRQAGCRIVASYVSMTEVSEYAKGLPEAMKSSRLRPKLPPDEMTAFCFYPMSKRRLGDDNWYRLSYEDRLALMHGHGATGRLFAGRILQLITGSTGLDDFEWGVTLFGRGYDDLKDCVYTMRFDEASARFAEFGPFYTGRVGEPARVLDALGLS